MLTAVAFGLIPVFMVMIALTGVLASYLVELEEEVGAFIIIFMIPAAIMAMGVAIQGTAGPDSPAEPLGALGLSIGTTVTFILTNTVLGVLLFLRNRREMKDQVEARIKDILRRKAKETDEILKRHGI